MKNLIGEFQWTPPRWLRRLGPLPAFYWLTALTVAALLVYAGVRHKQSKPRPPQVVASADAPALTPVVDGELVPQPLFVDFSVETDPRFAQEAVQSVARLDLVGKPVTEGISLAPSLDGVWTWVSGTRLRFEPAADWPAGQPFTVSYSETLFAPDLRLAATSADFATAPFEAAVDKVEFYQDPVEREVRKVVANLSFSHPVDTDSLANHIDFQIAQASGDAGSAALPLTYELQFGPQRRTAYVHSVPLAIAPTASFVTLTLNEGIAAANGPSRTEQLLSREIRIPDSSSYFQVSGAQALLARNENNEPVQNITLEFTDDVSTEALLRSLRAWILPTSLTLRGEEVTNARWHSPREVTPEVLAQAARTDLVLHPVENGSSRQHSAAIDVPEGAAIYVAVSQGLTSGGNFELAESFDTVLAAPAYPKEVRIAQDGAVLALSGSHQLTLMARGVATVRVEIGRLIDSEINHLASQTGGDITNPYFNSYSFGPENLTERFVRFIDVNASHPRTASFAALDLGELLSGGGQFFVNVQGWDRARKAAVGVSDERFVLITDLGLLVKANADASRDVFVHSIASGKPLVGASVELLGKNGLPVFRRVTGVSGHASFPATRDLEREKTPTVFVVRNGKDTVFLPFARSARRLQYSRFDVGGQYQRQGDAADALRALVFTDRGIYRPGDAANLGIVVKRRDWRPLERLPLLVNVYGPRGQAVLEKRVRLPASGLLEMPFPTAVESPTGNYTATVFLLEERNRRRALGSVSFKVEEFLPDALRIQSTLSGDGGEAWLQPKGLAVTVSLENLFGTPAADRRVTGELRLTPATVRVAGFENFTFDDPLREPGSAVQPVTLRLPDATTDVDGVATLALPLERYSAGIYRLVTELEGFEPGGGRSVTARSSAILSPLPVLVGHHSNSDLTFLHKASDHELQFVAVNPDGKGQTLNDLTLELVEERFVSALVKRENGTWDYQSVRKELPVSSGSFAIDEAGSSLPLATGNAGDFLVRLRGADGLVYSRVRYTVAGDRNLTGNLERNAELKLVTDASDGHTRGHAQS
ncbi:MAG: MG2 domain-containing protein [Pseudomonadota bacterium]